MAMVAGKDYYPLRIRKMSTEAEIISLVRTSNGENALKELDPADGSMIYSFFADSATDEFSITVTPSAKATVRVGYYDERNIWQGSGL